MDIETWTRESAWWLGATFGDGHNDNRKGRRCVVFVSGDRDLADKWAAVCGGRVKPKKTYWRAEVNDIRLSEWVASFGMDGKKADTLLWPDGLPEEFHTDFVRGLWDTDGSLTLLKGGTKHREGRADSLRAIFCNKGYHLVDVLVQKFPLLAREEQRVAKGRYVGNVYALATCRGSKALEFASLIYGNSPEHLRCERKYKVFEGYLAWKTRETQACEVCGEPALSHKRCRGCRKLKWEGTQSCVQCGESKTIIAKGLCRSCYQQRWRKTVLDRGWDKSDSDKAWLDAALSAYQAALTDESRTEIVDRAVAVFLKRGIPLYTAQEGVLPDPLSEVARSKLTVEGRVVRAVGSAGQRYCTSKHPHRYAASYRGNLSAVEAFKVEKAVRKAIKFQLSTGSPITPKRALRAVCALQKVPTNFPPTLARFLADTYAPQGGTVLDPCAGYGGRLLGVVSSAKQLRYIGFDIELRTAEANQKMAEALGVADRASCGRADLLDGGSWDPADLLLCGPPYYDCENYGDSSTTALRQLSYEEWVELFIGQLFRKGAHVPCIVLNVGTFLLKGTRKDYPEDVVREAQKHGFVLADRWQWKQASFGKSSRTEALLVFRRALLAT